MPPFAGADAPKFWSERTRLTLDPKLGDPLRGPVGRHFRCSRERGTAKWHHYFPVYDRHLGAHAGRDLRLLEIGVGRGGSLEMWREFLGAGAQIIGLDARAEVSSLAHDNVLIRIGNQNDRAFLRALVAQFGSFDVIIDDGSHVPSHQITALEELFPALSTDPGIYIVEDLHTNVWERHREDRPNFLDRAVQLIDALYEPYSIIKRVTDVLAQRGHGGQLLIGGRRRDESIPVTVSRLAASLGGIHFYDSMIVLEKVQRHSPTSESQPGSGFTDPLRD